MSTINSISARVAELSATLPPITSYGIDMLSEEMCGEAEDYCSYNGSFYCDGWIKPIFDDCFKGAILQSVEEYQVIRLFHINAVMEGLAQDEIPENWDDEDAPEIPELELKDVTEIQQIWLKHGENAYTLQLDDEIRKRPNALYYFGNDEESYIVHIHSLHYWCYEPMYAKIITDSVNERTDYYYDYYNGIPLKWSLSNTREYLLNAEPQFLQLVESKNMWEKAMNCKHIFKIAHRRGWQFPADEHTARLWFDYIKLLTDMQYDTHNPLYICPNNIEQAHLQLIEKQNKRNQELEMKKIKSLEKEFAKNHSYLFGIEFDNEHFKFKSLDSVLEYYNEGVTMHHCVYRMAYYNKHDVLTLHVSDMEGNRVATCSIDVVKGKIIELQTLCNNSAWREGEEYKEIWNVLTARKKYFPKPKRKRNKKQLKIAV